MPASMRELAPGVVVGRKRGVEVTVRQLVTPEEEPFVPAWTIVEARSACQALVFQLLPTGHGIAGEFEDAFAIEGAPRDLVERLLDRPARDVTFSLRPWLVRVRVSQAGVEVVLRGMGPIAEAVDLAAQLSLRTHVVEGEADEALLREAGDPFRGGVDSSLVAQRKATRADELRALARRYMWMHGPSAKWLAAAATAAAAALLLLLG